MTSRECLGWRVPETEWEAFQSFVAEKWGATDAYLRFELESAMREFLDYDETLHEAEQLLRTHTHSRGLSSSSASRGITHDSETTKLGHRVQSELKDEFAATAKDRFDRNLGRVLARALNSYRGGGRRQRVLDLVQATVERDSHRDTTDDADENLATDRARRDTTSGTDENRTRDTTDVDESGPTESSPTNDSVGESSTDAWSVTSPKTADSMEPTQSARSDTTNGAVEHEGDTTPTSDETASDRLVDARIVDEIADELGDSFLEDDLQAAIATRAGGNATTISQYTEAVTAYTEVVEHPVREGLYIPEQARANITVYEDLDRDRRVEALRTMLCAEALRHRSKTFSITYTDVQDLFDEEFSGSPSHDYAYTLMQDAAEASGFEYTTTASPYELRVNVQYVSGEYIADCERFDGVDTDLVDGLRTKREAASPDQPEEWMSGCVDLEITSYATTAPPSQEAATDD